MLEDTEIILTFYKLDLLLYMSAILFRFLQGIPFYSKIYLSAIFLQAKMNVSIIPYQGKRTAMFIRNFFLNLNRLIYELVSSSFQPQLQNFSFQIKPINLRLILSHLVNKSLTCLKELKKTVYCQKYIF